MTPDENGPVLGCHCEDCEYLRAEVFALPAVGPTQPLTEREFQVLAIAAQGLGNVEIGQKLFVTEDTVKSHMRRVLRKLGARNRTQAVTNAFVAGIPVQRPGEDFHAGQADQAWQLVQRAQAGDRDAFAQLYVRYSGSVRKFIYFRVGNRTVAEDLASEVWVRALKRIHTFTWQGKDLGAWLTTIARNLVADHFKSGRYRLEVTTGDVLDTDRVDRGPEGSPESAVCNHLENVTLLTVVKQLNPEQQECIVLRFLQGYSTTETAQAMGKNVGAIKALQYRAVRALARALPDGFDGFGDMPRSSLSVLVIKPEKAGAQ